MDKKMLDRINELAKRKRNTDLPRLSKRTERAVQNLSWRNPHTVQRNT